MIEQSLSRDARELAAEIRNHDWSDAPFRIDRAGHRRETDSASKLTSEVLTPEQTERVRLNVVWVVAQKLMHDDPNLDIGKFAEACGVSGGFLRNSDGRYTGGLIAGIRHEGNGSVSAPGSSR